MRASDFETRFHSRSQLAILPLGGGKYLLLFLQRFAQGSVKHFLIFRVGIVHLVSNPLQSGRLDRFNRTARQDNNGVAVAALLIDRR